MNIIDIKQFSKDTDKIIHTTKSSLGRINKIIQNIDEFIKKFKDE